MRDSASPMTVSARPESPARRTTSAACWVTAASTDSKRTCNRAGGHSNSMADGVNDESANRVTCAAAASSASNAMDTVRELFATGASLKVADVTTARLPNDPVTSRPRS